MFVRMRTVPQQENAVLVRPTGRCPSRGRAGSHSASSRSREDTETCRWDGEGLARAAMEVTDTATKLTRLVGALNAQNIGEVGTLTSPEIASERMGATSGYLPLLVRPGACRPTGQLIRRPCMFTTRSGFHPEATIERLGFRDFRVTSFVGLGIAE